MNVGDTVYYLWGYDFIPVPVLKINKKSIKIKIDMFGYETHDRNVSFESVAKADESICVIWETWKGVNGRGAHRIERELYPHIRMPAREFCATYRSFQYPNETEYGVLRI